MLDQVYQEKSIEELFQLLVVAVKNNSASVSDFNDLIEKKLQQSSLDGSYREKSIDELLHILPVAIKSGSSSVQDFKDLIVKKFFEQPKSYQDFVQQAGGWGFISDTVGDLRYLLIERNLYLPQIK